MPSKKPVKKSAARAKANHARKAVAATPYRISTPEEKAEVEWLVKDGTYRSVAHYKDIMTRQMALK